MIFQFLFFIFMKNKIKQNWKQINKNMLNKAKYKKLDWLKQKSKTHK